MFKDLTGQRFGRLKAIEYSHTESGRAFWKCRCDCGNIVIRRGKDILSGNTKSCGCLNTEQRKERMKEVGKKYWENGLVKARKAENHGNYVHGHSNTRLYHIWISMKQRCLNSNNRAYKDYGGRGITIYEEWENSFQVFYDWSMANGYSDNLSIDRIDNDKGYSPDNCRWVTIKKQQNNKRSNRIIEYKGESKTIQQWANEKGMNFTTLKNRIDHGWSIEKALETPVKRTNR